MLTPPKTTLGRAVYAGTALLLFAAGLAVGWQIRSQWQEHELMAQRAVRLLQTIYNAHETFSASDGIRPEFAPDRLKDLNVYSKRLVGLALDFPDPRPDNLDFAGGRLIPINGTSALLLTFRTPEGPVSIAAFKEPYPLPSELPEIGDAKLPVRVQTDSGYVTALVGQTDDSALKYLQKILEHVKKENQQ